MLIFGSSPGVVGAVITGQTLPFAISVGGNPGVAAFPGVTLCKSILTGFRFAGQSGLGLMHTLQDRIYVYVFGERAGRAEVRGIGFAGVCGPHGNWTGFDSVYAYYERVRSSTNGIPVRLVFGPATAIAGFMTDLEFSLEDAESGVGSFSFGFSAMPRVVGLGEVRPLPWE